MSPQDEEFRLEAENIDLRRLLAQAGIDAAEHLVTQRLQRMIVAELHHRVKNTLATVQAIVSQSLRAAHGVEEARQAIESRLLALGRAHDLLLQTNWSATKLEAIIDAAIQPFDTPAARQFVTRTPDIDVAPSAALSLAMVLNELCTNAVKYGALSRPAGRVEINATIDEDARRFRLTWAEMNGPDVRPPAKRSFGTKLIEHGFVTPLNGNASLSFDPAGVLYRLEVPLTSLQPQMSL